MAIDPTDPETFEPDRPVEPSETELDEEAPEADTAEQHTEVSSLRDDYDYDLLSNESFSADEADRAEQARFVAPDDDDYR